MHINLQFCYNKQNIVRRIAMSQPIFLNNNTYIHILLYVDMYRVQYKENPSIDDYHLDLLRDSSILFLLLESNSIKLQDRRYKNFQLLLKIQQEMN